MGSFTIREFEFFSQNTRLRFPFRYGIASMNEVPQQFVRVWIEIDGSSVEGLACEGLPPKWFTKNPATTFEADLSEMNAVIRHAADHALGLPKQPMTFFEFWRQLSSGQSAAARANGWPSLLSSL